MTIPDDLKIFSFIYEYRFFALVPLYALWIAGGFYFLSRLKKVFFLWLLIFPLVLSPLPIADFFGIKKAIRKTCNPQLQTPAGDGILPMRRLI